MSKKKPKHYVDNKELYEEFCKYYELKQEALANGEEIPPLTDKICVAIMNIAEKFCYTPSFMRYSESWKEEMRGDAIEVCVKYAHNFDPTKYKNPFAYLTQFIHNAYIQRIERERRQLYYRYKAFDNSGGFEAFTDDNASDLDVEVQTEMTDMYRDHLEFIHTYEKSREKVKEKKRKTVKTEPKGLEKFM